MDTGCKSPAASPTKDAGSKRPVACSSSAVSQLMSTAPTSVSVDGLWHGCKRKASPEQIGIDLLESKRARAHVDVFHKMVKDLEYQHAFERNNLARKIIMGMEQVPVESMSSMVNYDYGLMSNSGLCYQPLRMGEYGANNKFVLNELEKNVGFEDDISRKVPPTSQSRIFLENDSVDMIQGREKITGRSQAMSSLKNYETSFVGVTNSTGQSDLERAKSGDFELLSSTVNQSTSNGIQALSCVEESTSGSSGLTLKRRAISMGETSKRRNTCIGPGDNNPGVAKGQWSEEESQMVTMVNEREKKLHDGNKEKWMEIVNALPGTNAKLHECKEGWNSHLNPDNKIKAGSLVTAHHNKEVIKGQWSEEESQLLRKMVNQREKKDEDKEKWMEIAKAFPGRNAKQCKERWNNHLNPDINKDIFSLDEEKALIEAHMELGHKWAEISRRRMPGRAENTIKNRWNAAYRKVFERLKPPVSLLEKYVRSLGPRPKVRPSATKACPAPAETYVDANSPALLADTRINGNTVPVLKTRPPETSQAGSFCFLPVQIVGRYLQPPLLATTSQSELLLPEKETYAMANQQPEPAPDIQTIPTCVGLTHNYTNNDTEFLEVLPPSSIPSTSPVMTCSDIAIQEVDRAPSLTSQLETCCVISGQPSARFGTDLVEIQGYLQPNSMPATSSQSELFWKSCVHDWEQKDGNECSAMDNEMPEAAPDIEQPLTCMDDYSSCADLTDNYFSEVHPPPSLLSISPVETCSAIPYQAPAAPITFSATSIQSKLIAGSHIGDWLRSDGNDYSALPSQVEDHSLIPMPVAPAPEMHCTSIDHGNEHYMDALTEYIKEGNHLSLDDMTEEELERLAMCFEV